MRVPGDHLHVLSSMIQVVTGACSVIAAIAWRAPNGLIRPRALSEEIEEPLLRALRAVRVTAGACRDGLYALALPVAQDAEGVRRERFSLLAPREMAADRLEVGAEAAGRGAAKPVLYTCRMHAQEAHGNRRSTRRRRMDPHSEKQTTSEHADGIRSRAPGRNLRQ